MAPQRPATLTIRELMTTKVVTVPPAASLVTTAARLRDDDATEVLVVDGAHVVGVLTDRDIVVRAVADGLDPSATTAGEICGAEFVSIRPEAGVDEAIGLMRDRSVRRIPVIDQGEPIGMLRLGDLAIARNRRPPVASRGRGGPRR